MTASANSSVTAESPVPPGPPARGLLGNLPEFTADTLGYLERVREMYGTVVHMRFGRFPVWLISDPALIHQVLVSEHTRYIKNQGFWRHFRQIFGKGLLTNEGADWRRQRRLAAPAFQHRRLAQYGEFIARYTERKLAAWKVGQVRDLHEDMMKITADIVARALFNVDLDETHEDLSSAIHGLENQIPIRVRRPFVFLDYLPLPSNFRYWRDLRVVERYVYGFIEEHRRNPDQGNSLLSMLMAARDEEGHPMDDRQLRDEVLTLFLAGHDTTAITLSWAFYLLNAHPCYWGALESEWQSVLGGRDPGWDDLSRLPLTRGVVRESLRLYPAAYLIGRQTLEPLKIGPWHVREGSSVLISPYLMGRDNRFYASPEQFLPERWTPEFEKQLPRYAFMPFGGGPRICIGEGLAMMEAQIILIMIGRRFRPVFAGKEEPKPFISITMPPLGGMPMRIERAPGLPAGE